MHPEEDEGSVFLRHEPCENCGSTDNKGVYSDGHTFCFGCRHRTGPTDQDNTDETTSQARVRERSNTLAEPDRRLRGVIQAIPNRRLDEDTCALFGYEVGEFNGKPCHIANHKGPNGQVIAQHIRLPGKDFPWLGDSKAVGFYGQWLWSKGKRLVITEGEIDALSMSQVMGNKWPVVSLPGGADSVEKTIKKSWDWLEGFEEIILMFDMDEAGHRAALKAADMLPMGKVKIAKLPLKDANEMLVKGKAQELMQCFWNAAPYKPDGIVTSKDLRDALFVPEPVGLSYPFSILNEKLQGILDPQLIVVTSGSGLGKSTFVREIAYHLHTVHKQQVGMIFLEESTRKTIKSFIGLHLNKRLRRDLSNTSPQEMDKAYAELFSERDLVLYDHFGSTDLDNIISRIRYMAKAMGCKYIVLDHLSIMVSGQVTDDERKLIDLIMTKLRTVVQELGITLFLVSHLKRPSGDKGHEDGAQVNLGQLRGSHAIAQLADAVIGMQKPADDPMSDTTELVILKNREEGDRGSAGILTYNKETGRLTESVF